MPVKHTFMTSNLGLQYTVDRVSLEGSKEDADADYPLPSLPYHDHVLENCDVDEINIVMVRSDRSSQQNDTRILERLRSWDSSTANALAHCDIASEKGVYRLNFSTAYSTANQDYRYMTVVDPRNSSSLWWGSRLLNNYFSGIQAIMTSKLVQDEESVKAITRAQLTYKKGKSKDTRAHDLFDVSYYFLLYDGVRTDDDTWDIGTDTSKLYNNPDYRWSYPLTEGFFFAKVLRSIILADLGDRTTPNLLLSENELKYALAPNDDFNRAAGGLLDQGTTEDRWLVGGISPPSSTVKTQDTVVDMNQTYDAFKGAMGPLGTKPAQIYAQYACQVPVRKGTGTTLLFVLVAVLSLMQTAWALFKWFAEIAVEVQGDPTAMYCEGCSVKTGTGAAASLIKNASPMDHDDVEMGMHPITAYRPLDR